MHERTSAQTTGNFGYGQQHLAGCQKPTQCQACPACCPVLRQRRAAACRWRRRQGRLWQGEGIMARRRMRREDQQAGTAGWVKWDRGKKLGDHVGTTKGCPAAACACIAAAVTKYVVCAAAARSRLLGHPVLCLSILYQWKLVWCLEAAAPEPGLADSRRHAGLGGGRSSGGALALAEAPGGVKACSAARDGAHGALDVPAAGGSAREPEPLHRVRAGQAGRPCRSLAILSRHVQTMPATHPRLQADPCRPSAAPACRQRWRLPPCCSSRLVRMPPACCSRTTTARNTPSALR